jgi:hypothetical protein
MTTKFVQLAIAALAGAGVVTLVFTITPLRAHTGWMPLMHGPGQPGQPMGLDDDDMPCLRDGVFAPDSLEILQGTATQVNRYGGHQGTFMTLTTPQETLEVHLGPAWYLQNQGFDIVLNSPIQVTGFRSSWNGQSVLMATEIRQGDRVLPLRDAEGYPLWRQMNVPSN